jgi:hypothetical protein
LIEQASAFPSPTTNTITSLFFSQTEPLRYHRHTFALTSIIITIVEELTTRSFTPSLLFPGIIIANLAFSSPNADPNTNIGLGQYPSPNALSTRQLVDAIRPERMNLGCTDAIISKYDHVYLNTMSLAEKKDLLSANVLCRYSPAKFTDKISAREATDTAITARAAEKCSFNLIKNAWLRIKGHGLNEQNTLAWWIIFAACLKSDPSIVIVPEGKMVRDVEDFDPAKNQECIQSVTQSWPGDLSTKEDRNAFMVSIVQCINGS